MPWKGVTVSEQRQRFLEDYQLNYYSVSDLAERFGISRNTAYRWINRFKQYGQAGYHELSRRPHTCPWQTDKAISDELVKLRKSHPSWGPKKLLDLMEHRDPGRQHPSVSTGASFDIARDDGGMLDEMQAKSYDGVGRKDSGRECPDRFPTPPTSLRGRLAERGTSPAHPTPLCFVPTGCCARGAKRNWGSSSAYGRYYPVKKSAESALILLSTYLGYN